MIIMFFFGYAEIYEPLGTIIAVLIVAVVSAKLVSQVTQNTGNLRTIQRRTNVKYTGMALLQ